MSRITADTIDRRPIAARERPVFRRIACGLHERGVTANAISLAGLGAGVAAGLALAATTIPGWERAAWLVGAGLVQLRLLANLLDGMVAVESGTCSPVGELYNEVPDRLSDTATLVGLGLAAGGTVVLGGLAAIVALFVAFVRAASRVAGAAQSYCGPMAKPHRMFVVTVVALWLGLAPAAWQPSVGGDAGLGLAGLALIVIIVGGVVTAARRLRRTVAALRAVGG